MTTNNPHSMGLYAVRDDAVDAYDGVFEAQTDKVAMRSLRQFLSNTITSTYAVSPNDFALVKLGTVCKRTGLLTSDPEQICRLSALMPVQDVA